MVPDFLFARDWIRSLHDQRFQLSDNTFDAVHYGAMAMNKPGFIGGALISKHIDKAFAEPAEWL